MNLLAYISAARDFSWIEIVVIAIIFLASIIGSAIQKAKQKQQEDKSRKPRAKSEPSGRRETQAPTPRTVQPTRPKPPAVPQPARSRQAPAEQTVRVSEELQLRQKRQAQLEKDRQKRLGVRTSPESDTAPRQISEVGVILNLQTPADAQRAIILHEIFSPPKALRQGGEMWDT
ncbi:MAG: hypothetical protein ISS69_19010 [Phycisphaerae bacterium]|nr:hypothetical protein [Phycisphaerae bacterium]